MRWWIGLSLAVLLSTVSLSYADDRRGSPFPTDEHWEGSRTKLATTSFTPVGNEADLVRPHKPHEMPQR
jgi:hypothetical protein